MWTNWGNWTICSGCGRDNIQSRLRECVTGYNCKNQTETEDRKCEAIDKCTGMHYLILIPSNLPNTS